MDSFLTNDEEEDDVGRLVLLWSLILLLSLLLKLLLLGLLGLLLVSPNLADEEDDTEAREKRVGDRPVSD